LAPPACGAPTVVGDENKERRRARTSDTLMHADFWIAVGQIIMIDIRAQTQTPAATPRTSTGPACDGLECLTSVPAPSRRADFAGP
jgi:hypothetical protein